MADDFLINKPSSKDVFELSAVQENDNEKSQIGSDSKISNTTIKYLPNGQKDFKSMNKDRAASYNPYKKPMICDQLDEDSQAKLKVMIDDVDSNLDKILEEKKAYYNLDPN